MAGISSRLNAAAHDGAIQHQLCCFVAFGMEAYTGYPSDSDRCWLRIPIRGGFCFCYRFDWWIDYILSQYLIGKSPSEAVLRSKLTGIRNGVSLLKLVVHNVAEGASLKTEEGRRSESAPNALYLVQRISVRPMIAWWESAFKRSDIAIRLYDDT